MFSSSILYEKLQLRVESTLQYWIAAEFATSPLWKVPKSRLGSSTIFLKQKNNKFN